VHSSRKHFSIEKGPSSISLHLKKRQRTKSVSPNVTVVFDQRRLQIRDLSGFCLWRSSGISNAGCDLSAFALRDDGRSQGAIGGGNSRARTLETF
jgi:hypothetical protein